MRPSPVFATAAILIAGACSYDNPSDKNEPLNTAGMPSGSGTPTATGSANGPTGPGTGNMPPGATPPANTPPGQQPNNPPANMPPANTPPGDPTGPDDTSPANMPPSGPTSMPTGDPGPDGAGGDMGMNPSPGSGGMNGPNMSGGEAGAGGAGMTEPTPTERGEGPCDIYEAAGNECVGAYSMVRVLSSTWDGPLYQVRKGAPDPFRNTGSGGETMDIGMLPNGFADAAAQDAFCGDEACTVSVLYDQSGLGNDLTVAKGGCYEGTASEDDYESSATDGAVSVGGNNVYSLYMRTHEGYRNNQATGTAEGNEDQGVYMVAAGSALRPNAGCCCCWNFGTASRDNCYGPTGMMGALYLGIGYWGTGQGQGPWFMGDFEAGVWAGGSGPSDANNPMSPAMTMEYAFGILKVGGTSYALRMGNAAMGDLTTAYDGPTGNWTWQLEGGIILGIGGDNSNSSDGTFFEGVITHGRPSNETDEAVFRNVQAAGYGQ